MIKKYFISSINFRFIIKDEMELINEEDALYVNKITKERYKKRLLLDCGWGQEPGYIRQPPLEFNDVLNLVVNFNTYENNEEIRTISFSNCLGAIAVIMEDFIEELIDFLKQTIDTDFFDCKRTRENFKLFCFSTDECHKEGKLASGIGIKSYEDILNEHDLWREISKKVVEKIYC